MAMKIYPAGPDAFLPDARDIGQRKPAPYATRTARFGDVTTSSDGRLIDTPGLTVEDFRHPDNPMIHAPELHGCALVVPQGAPADIRHDLASFEACVRLAAKQAG
jgi:hypothetical protein